MDARQELAAGSEEEVEIRCCSIAAVEALRAALTRRCMPIHEFFQKAPLICASNPDLGLSASTNCPLPGEMKPPQPVHRACLLHKRCALQVGSLLHSPHVHILCLYYCTTNLSAKSAMPSCSYKPGSAEPL